MNFLKKIFTRHNNRKEPEFGNMVLTEIEKKEIAEFSKLKEDDKMRKLISLCNNNEVNLVDFRLFQYAVLFDSSKSVKFSALKRIHLFKQCPELEPMLRSLNADPSSKPLEPYFSMALLRTGSITEEAFKQRIESFDAK